MDKNVFVKSLVSQMVTAAHLDEDITILSVPNITLVIPMLLAKAREQSSKLVKMSPYVHTEVQDFIKIFCMTID